MKRHAIGASRSALATLLLAIACGATLAGAPANAVTLHAGDVLVLGGFPVGTILPQVIILVEPATGSLQYIDLHPALTDMQDLVIRESGEILVSDGYGSAVEDVVHLAATGIEAAGLRQAG